MMSSFEGGGEDKKEGTPALERIIAAALQYNGEVFKGVTHIDALTSMDRKFPNYDYKLVTSGFLTSSRRFVDRKEALEIADHADQLMFPREHYGDELLAEWIPRSERDG